MQSRGSGSDQDATSMVALHQNIKPACRTSLPHTIRTCQSLFWIALVRSDSLLCATGSILHSVLCAERSWHACRWLILWGT